MRLPPPARAATAAGILLATAVLLLAADLTVVQMAGDEADVVPFFVQTENFTAAGMRVTNAGSFDTIQAYEMLSLAACGHAYRNPVLVPYVPTNETGNSTRVFFRDANGTAWSYNFTDYFLRPQLAGRVTFYVVESTHTADLLRGLDVPTYLTDARASTGRNTTVQIWEPLPPSNGTGGTHRLIGGERIVSVHVSCQGDYRIEIERGPHPGVNVRYAFDSTASWVADLPVNQGVDFVYVARADEQKDNETYVVLAENLRRGSESWTFLMGTATVFDDEGVLPDRILRALIIITLAAAIACLALALRRQPQPLPPTPTEAAWVVAAAGESHLLRLRRTWALVGALLIPLLAAATYVLFAVVPFTAPTSWWETSIGAFVLVLDVAVLMLWALAWRRAHQDLRAWRRAWTRLDTADLDSL